MAKTIRRMLAMALVMCMFVSALPMQALAAEDGTVTEGPVVENTADGLTVTTTTTTNTTTEGENTTVTVTIEKVTEGTSTEGTTVNNTETTTNTNVSNDETGASSESTVVVETRDEVAADGATTEFQQTTTDSTTVDGDGTVTTQTTVEGSETKTWDEEDAGNEPGQPEVNVDLIPGEETSGTATDTTVEGDVNTLEGQTTTTTTDRTVTAETSNEETKVTVTDTTLEGLESELKFDRNDTADQKDKKKETDLYTDNGHFTDTSTITVTDAPEDAPFKFVGTGDYSGHYVSHIRVIYARDENGNALKDENGEYIIKELQKSDGTVLTKNGVPTTDLNGPYDQKTGTRPQQFLLMNEQGDAVYGYCIDLDTGAKSGNFYGVSNLEDNDYYASEEAENHVRNIVTNGYWGTSEGTGSMTKIKSDLKAAVAAGTVDKEYDITFVVQVKKYTDGYELQEGEYVGNGYVCKHVTEHIVLTDEVIDSFTEGEALDATQSAIWSYANGSKLALDGTDRMIVGDVTYASCAMGDSLNGQNDFAGAARTLAFYNYLVNLNDEITSTTVINDKNNVEDMSLTVGDKVAGHAANLDDNADNDVYNAEMNFTLAFVPDPKSDDLLVHITYKHNGEDVTVIRRLAGENTEGRNHEAITAVNGVYTLTGLQLSENEDLTFDLRLEGTQYLEQGVYVYTAQGGVGTSQTMVGMAEGTNTVDVSKSVTISFDVDENNHVVAEREWHYEEEPIVTPPEKPPVPAEEPPVPAVFRLNNDGLEEIPEEPVPLATPVITGDNSGLWIAVVLLSIFAMAAINLSDKKRQHEAF